MQNLNKRYLQDPNMVSRVIVDETILVPIRQNVGDMESIYTLNDTASFAWSLLDGENTLEEIRDQIVVEYDVDKEDAQLDLLELIAQLQEIGALQEL